MRFHLADEAATQAFASRFYRALPTACLVFLRGELGAGKTAFVRACLREAGYRGAVKSPTYTLVEEYFLEGRSIHHFDLYRLAEPEELEWMGIRDYFRPDTLCFIEWPERGEGILPEPDVDISLSIDKGGRILELSVVSDAGSRILDDLMKPLST